ncbi:MAG TPA: phage holin family protein [Chroococcales cyanobacterium]
MTRQLVRLLLIAAAFYFVFPHIPGIEVHGSFLHLFIGAIFFAVLGWLVEVLAIALSAMVTIGTLGLALFILAPLWLLGFWLLPAYVLKLMSELMPTYMSIAGWTPAILGGLVMLAIGIATSGAPSRYGRQATA